MAFYEAPKYGLPDVKSVAARNGVSRHPRAVHWRRCLSEQKLFAASASSRFVSPALHTPWAVPPVWACGVPPALHTPWTVPSVWTCGVPHLSSRVSGSTTTRHGWPAMSTPPLHTTGNSSARASGTVSGVPPSRSLSSMDLRCLAVVLRACTSHRVHMTSRATASRADSGGSLCAVAHVLRQHHCGTLSLQ